MTVQDDQQYHRVHRFATIALACLLLFFLSAIAAQFVRTDLNAVRNFMSAYAIGHNGFVMTVGFVAIGIGCLMLAAGLWLSAVDSAARTGRSGRIGPALVGIAGLSMFAIAAFPAEIDVAEPTIIGQLHDLSAMIHFTAVTVGALAVSLSLRRHALWLAYARSELLLAVALVIAFLFFFTTYPLQAGSPPAVPLFRALIGLIQRLLIGADWLWLVVTAFRLRQLTAR